MIVTSNQHAPMQEVWMIGHIDRIARENEITGHGAPTFDGRMRHFPLSGQALQLHTRIIDSARRGCK
jgi:hypothetical protein